MTPADRILVVGAGWEQLPIIERALERGLEVIAVDGNDAAPGLALAHRSHIVSTRDRDGVLAVAKTERVGAITFMITETPLHTIRHVATHLGLPCPSEASVVMSTDKATMRERFAASGIANPPFARCTTAAQATAAAHRIGFPLIVKPVDSGGQRGLTLCSSADALPSAVATALKASPDAVVLLERFMLGHEVNVVAMVRTGQVAAMTVSDRVTADAPAFGVVRHHLYPSSAAHGHEAALRDLVQASVDAMDIDDGVVFPQIMITADGPVLLETGARIPGGTMRELFEAATGYDLVEYQLDVSLGRVRPLDAYRTSDPAPAVAVRFVTAEPGDLRAGRVEAIQGEAAARAIAGVHHIGLFAGTADRKHVHPLRTGGDRYYVIVTVGSDAATALDTTEHALRHLDFVGTDGVSLNVRTPGHP